MSLMESVIKAAKEREDAEQAYTNLQKEFGQLLASAKDRLERANTHLKNLLDGVPVKNTKTDDIQFPDINSAGIVILQKPVVPEAPSTLSRILASVRLKNRFDTVELLQVAII